MQTCLEIEKLQTFAFRLFVSLLLLGGVAYGVRLIRIRQKRMEHEMQMKHELLTVSMEREKERQIRVERENFFTGVAHELRTPLTLILAPLQELMKQCNPLEDFYKKLQVMYKNAASLHTLVDQLLYVQKIGAGMVRLQLSEIDLVQLVCNVSEPFRQMAEIKGLQFDVDLPEGKFLYWVDEGKIASAVQNLLSNAFKYTPSGGRVLLSVSHLMKSGQGYCRITVSDTGAGIPEWLQKYAFESFVTGDNVGFKERVLSQRLIRSERPESRKFSFYFSTQADSLPLLKGLNFDETNAFIVEKPTGRIDTLHYWIRDSLIYKMDTLKMSLTYLYTDSNT